MPLPEITLQIRADDPRWERLVYAELLVPETPNVYGDFWTREEIRLAMLTFMKTGFGIDVNHDQVDLSASIRVVESFIVRAHDPDFIEGSWVLGMYIGDDTLWEQILRGEINGYSYEALVQFLPMELESVEQRIYRGQTEPDPLDGHTHEWVVFMGRDGRPLLGGTSWSQGHTHPITTHTVTELAAAHRHRFNILN